MSSFPEHTDTARIQIIISERDIIGEPELIVDDENYEPPISFEEYYILTERQDVIATTGEFVTAIHSEDAGWMRDWYDLEHRYRQVERGASGEAYEILLSVGSGIASGVATHVIAKLIDSISKRTISEKEQALKQALTELVIITRKPRRYFEQVHFQEKGNGYVFIFRDRYTKFHLVEIYKELKVHRYRVFEEGTNVDVVLLYI